MPENALALWMHRKKLKSMDKIEALMKKRKATDERLANIGF